MTPERPDDKQEKTPARQGAGASKAEGAVRDAPASDVAPREKRTIGAETSREEDA